MVRVRWLLASAVVLAGACKGEDKPAPAATAAPPPVAAPAPKLELVRCAAAPPQRQGAEPDPAAWGLGSGSLGRYGTIGHGIGTGAGISIGGGHHSAPRSVTLGQPAHQGSLDKVVIRRYVRRNIQKIQYCYEKELLSKPNLEGTVSAQFFITPEGKVSASTASGMDDVVAKCVADVLATIEFPKPAGGGGVQVNYPFKFHQAGSTASSPPPPPAPASGQRQFGMIGLIGSDVLEQWTPYARTRLAVDVAPGTVAEVTTAVRAKLPDLERCFASTTDTGRLRALVAIPADAGPNTVRAGGFGDAAVERCVAEALVGVQLTKPAEPTEIACDFARGADTAWRATVTGGYSVIGATKAGVVVNGLPVAADKAGVGANGQPASAPKLSVPRQRVALVILEADTGGDVLATALTGANNAAATLVAVHGAGAPVLVAEPLDDAAHAFELRVDHGMVHAHAADGGSDEAVALADGAKLADAITRGRAACGATPCPVRVVFDAQLSGADLLTVAAAARTAGVELVGLTASSQ